jgi:hypothetical protein
MSQRTSNAIRAFLNKAIYSNAGVGKVFAQQLLGLASLHSLAASLRHFIQVCGLQAKRSSGKKGREPLPRAYTVLCRFVCPNLDIRLKKTVLYGFLSFSHWKLWVFLRFHTFFFHLKYTGKYWNQRIIRCFVTVKSVFFNRYTASFIVSWRGGKKTSEKNRKCAVFHAKKSAILFNVYVCQWVSECVSEWVW